MLKIRQIENFLLLKYRRPQLIPPPNSDYTAADKSLYLACQDILYYRSVEQIQHFYPRAHIHVLTNETLPSQAGISYYRFDEEWTNHICKFRLYSLLNEPAMYVDLDIVLNKPFPRMDRFKEYAFYCFNLSYGENIQQYSAKPLPSNPEVTYNSGVVWIAKPHPNVTADLLSIHERYFNDVDMIFAKNRWPYNDEHALAFYAAERNYEMPLDKRINMPRKRIKDSFDLYQSIHYNGVRDKQQMLVEYKMFEVSKYHSESIKRYFGV